MLALKKFLSFKIWVVQSKVAADQVAGVTGADQVAAAMGIYGPRTTYVLAIKGFPGTHEFLLLDEDWTLCLQCYLSVIITNDGDGPSKFQRHALVGGFVYVYVQTSILTIFDAVESVREQFYSPIDNYSRKDVEPVNELCDAIENIKSGFQSLARPTLRSHKTTQICEQSYYEGGYQGGAIERYGEDPANHPPLDTQLWHDVTGGTKKDRSFGFGNHSDPTAILGGSSSTGSASSSSQQHIVENLMSQVQELKAREEERRAEDERRREEEARREEARHLEQDRLRAQYEEMCELVGSDVKLL